MQPLEQSVEQFPANSRITTLPLGRDAFEFGRLGIIRGLSRVDGTLLTEPSQLTCELSLIESAERESCVQPLDLAVDVLDCTGSGRRKTKPDSAATEPELNGGKLCEAAYSIVRGYVDGSYPSKPIKPPEMVGACRALESSGNHIPRSFRIQVPRAIVALYEIRNNRGVGHAGADVDPNHGDALVVLAMAKWIVAELIRILHQTDTEAARQAVDSLATRNIPIVWTVGRMKRVLEPSLQMKERMLLLLYAETKPVQEADLVQWVEHSNPSVFRRDVIRATHKARLIEYDKEMGTVEISPRGIAYVDDHLPMTITGAPKTPAKRRRPR